MKIKTLNILISNYLDDKDNNPASGIQTLRWIDGTLSTDMIKYDKIEVGLGDNSSVSMSLYRVEYDKQIYKPGKIVLTLSLIGNIDFDRLPAVLRETFSETVVNLYGNTGTTQKGDDVTLATNYYIHSISEKRTKVPKPQGAGLYKDVYVGYNTEKQLELVCYSPDNKLAVNKYCMTYTQKRFAKDVLKVELDTAGKGIFSKKGITFNKQVLCNTFWEKGENSDDQELIQPYLVQYNESFYDFITRVASRCGEFLYYEDGKLNYGLPQNTVAKSKVKSFKNIVLFGHPEIDINFDEEGISTKKLTSYAYDYSSNTERKDGDFMYNSQITSDDYLRETTMKDKTSFSDIISTWEAVSCFGAGFSAESVEGFLSNMLDDVATNFGRSFIAYQIASSDFEKGYVKKNNCMATTGLDYSKNLSNSLYHKIQKGSEKATKGRICVDTESYLQDFKLGDAVKASDNLGESAYVVTRMHGVLCNEIKQEFGRIGGDDEMGLKFKPYSVVNHYVEAVPVTDSEFYPPECGVSPIRKAEPQVGVVTANDDPLRLGRVRIDFAWQHNVENETVHESNMNAKSIGNTYSSPWLRVAVPFTGNSNLGGMNMTLDKGEHVMLNFIGGNIECPYVEGALFTKGNNPNVGWVDLRSLFFGPKYTPRVIASSSGHSISFLDGKNSSAFTASLCPPVGQLWNLAKGAVKLYEKSHNIDSKDAYDFKGDCPELFGGIVLRDALGIYEIATSTHGRSISINSPVGKVDINAFTGITISAPNGDVKIVGKNVSIEAGNNVSIVSGKNIRDKKFDFVSEASKQASSLAGSILKKIAVGASLDYLGVFDPTKLADVSFMRSCWEVIMRPVEGSLKLNSKRNVMMTAGKGNVTVPASSLSHATIMSKSKSGLNKLSDLGEENARKYEPVKDGFVALKEIIDTVFSSYRTSVERIRRKIKEVQKLTVNLPTVYKQGVVKDNKFTILDSLLREGKLADYSRIYDLIDEEELYILRQTNRNEANRAGIAWRIYNEIKTMYNASNIPNISDSFMDHYSLLPADWRKVLAYFTPKACYDELLKTIAFREETIEMSKVIQKQLFRDVCYKILTECEDLTNLYLGNVKDESGNEIPANLIITSDDAWKFMVNAIVDKKPTTPDGKAMSSFKAFTSNITPLLTAGVVGYDPDKGVSFFDSIQKLINYNGVSGPRSAWDVGNNGSILLSNSSGTTYELSSKGNSWQEHSNCTYLSVIDFLKSATIDHEQ